MASSPQLNVCLSNCGHAGKIPKFVASAFHVCDFTADTLTKLKTPYKTQLEAIIFVGSFQGEVIRWLVHEQNAVPYSTSYGHIYNTKIVQFEECTFPLVRNAIISLSYDGSICVWNVLDGICLRHYTQILPKGCQRIACSNTAIEIAAVCGAFPNIYIVDIQEGCIKQEIRPIPKFSVCLKFYSEGDAEWLFALGSNGCASFTTLTPKTASSHRYGIFSTEKNSVLIGAYPSPRFSFAILVYKKGYSIVALFSKDFPHKDYNCPNIQSAVWLRENSFALIKYDGSFEIFSLEMPDPKLINPASVIKSNGYVTDKYIYSTLEYKSSSEILECKSNIATLINPFVKIPFTREKIEQTSIETINEYKKKLRENLSNVNDSFQINDNQNNKNSIPESTKPQKSSKYQIKRSESESIKKTKAGLTLKINSQDEKGKDKSRKRSDTKISSKKTEEQNDTFESHNSTTESESIPMTDQVDIDYEVKTEFQLSGESNIPLPLISTFNGDLAFAFDDYIILASKGYQEYSLSDASEIGLDENVDEDNRSEDGKKSKSHSKSKSSKHSDSDASSKKETPQKSNTIVVDNENYVTAQSYLISDNLIQALIEGTNKGEVTIQYLNGTKKILGTFHKGRIVAMCTFGDFLFTSGKDCRLNVFSIQKHETLKFYSNFVSPVTKFFFPCKPTHTSIDDCIFCATSDGIISVIDISKPKTNNLFLLTSHESPIEKIYFHPPTKLLLVQCRSLYFWSMITGNLESIMNGQQMYKYLNDMKDNLFEVTDEKSLIGTPRPYITRFGNFYLRATEVNISEFAFQVGRFLDLHSNETLKKVFTNLHNLPFIVNLLPFKAGNEINSIIRKDSSSSSDSKKKSARRIHRNMEIGFSGSDNILTINLLRVMKKTEWLYSAQVTALLLSVRIALLFSIMHHPFISSSDAWTKIFNDIAPIFGKHPDLACLIKITLDLDARVHQYIFTMIQNYKTEQRQRYLNKIIIIRKNKVFPYYQKFFDFLYMFIKMSFFSKLENEAKANEYAQFLYNYQKNPLNYRAEIAREIIGFHNKNNINNMLVKKPMIDYYKDDQKKELILNSYRFSKFLLPSTDVDYFIHDDFIVYLNTLSSYVRNNCRKMPADSLKIIGNLAHVFKFSERCNFVDRCAVLLGITSSYFIAGCNNTKTSNKLTSMISSILEDLSQRCHFFDFKTGNEATFIAFGSNDGTIYIYKLRKLCIDKITKFEELSELFERAADQSENGSTNTLGPKIVPNSKSFSAMAQSNASSSANSPTSNSLSSNITKSKSFTASATNNNNNNNNNNNLASAGLSNNDDIDNINSTSESEATYTADSTIQGSSANPSAFSPIPVDSVIFGSIQINSKSQIHSIAISADDSAVFAASDQNIYRVAISGESSSSSSSPSYDEKSLKPKLKLTVTSSKEMGEIGIFKWDNNKLKYPSAKSKYYEITPSSEKI